MYKLEYASDVHPGSRVMPAEAGGQVDLDNGSDMFLRNVWLPPDYVELQHIRSYSSQSPQQKPQISQDPI
jgi:hypothetical protein